MADAPAVPIFVIKDDRQPESDPFVDTPEREEGGADKAPPPVVSQLAEFEEAVRDRGSGGTDAGMPEPPFVPTPAFDPTPPADENGDIRAVDLRRAEYAKRDLQRAVEPLLRSIGPSFDKLSKFGYSEQTTDPFAEGMQRQLKRLTRNL